MSDATYPPRKIQRNSSARLSAVPGKHRDESPPNNLPSELSSSVGREKELAEVTLLLAHTRLLTLTGPGGCGKTRLALAAAGVPSLTFSSLTTFLMVFAVRLVNPADGPLGEHPGWNAVALPGLQGSGYSPLVATLILAPLVAGWHLPLFFLEEGALQPPILVGGLVTTMAVTFWYAWLFNHTRGSVLLVVVAHSVEGSIQAEIGWIYMGVWLAVAIGLVVFDRKAWRGPAPEPATTARSVPSGEATPTAHLEEEVTSHKP